MRATKQASLCIACHTVVQRLARWLQSVHDRAGADRFPMTQDVLTRMVAATRPRVGEAAGKLPATD